MQSKDKMEDVWHQTSFFFSSNETNSTGVCKIVYENVHQKDESICGSQIISNMIWMACPKIPFSELFNEVFGQWSFGFCVRTAYTAYSNIGADSNFTGKLENSLPEACHEFQNTFCKLQSCKCSHRLASDDIACHTLCLYWPDRAVVCRPLTSFAPHHFSSKPIRFFYWIFCVFSIRQIILICLSAAAFRLTVSARRLGESVQIGSC